ncbi:18444_t:CDS:2 [Dentiscutata erythropus]|uniref:18444_t:CDS:1 n=1 Tax=Dentiscutata erythropus TaxID=1348616 RepID=A0A9N8Z045_9GLOM|nr:18444_t:CDS:2 [Dentiscutata erythropus]
MSIDEMIARFLGRSIHTVRIKNKPIPEGYKILSLCDAGMEENDQTKKPSTRSQVEELTHQFENIGANLPTTQIEIAAYGADI